MLREALSVRQPVHRRAPLTGGTGASVQLLPDSALFDVLLRDTCDWSQNQVHRTPFTVHTDDITIVDRVHEPFDTYNSRNPVLPRIP